MHQYTRLKIYRYGFTLVELLVVIAIIGLLSTVAIVAITPARQSARDAKRIADLRQITQALELYYDANGVYPPSTCGYNCNGYSRSYNTDWDGLQTALSQYLNPVPKDPINSSCDPWTDGCYSYAYGNVGTNGYNKNSYDLVARLENPNNPSRCGVRDYTWAGGHWCTAFGGAYSNQLYDASP